MPIPPEKMKDAYDVAVVGGGLGGMTAANRLARFGRKVLLLEQHTVLGGLAAYFRRRGHVFDVALHGFPAGMIKTCRKYWSKEIAQRIVPLERIRFLNPQFSLETTYEETDFTNKLIGHFGIAPETVASFFETVRSMNFYDRNEGTTGELLERFFPGRSDVVRFLMEPITYANGSTLDEPAITYGIVFSNFMSKGVYTVQGGTDWLIGAMEAELEKNGVDIVLGTPCDQILIERGAAAGVHAAERVVWADAIVSNANLKATILDLIGDVAWPEGYRAAAEATRLSTSSCQVYLGLKPGETLPEIGDLLFTSEHPVFDPDAMAASEVTSRTYSVYYPKTRPERAADYTVVASSNARYEDWDGLEPEAYEAKKKALIDQTLAHLDGIVPGIARKIDHAEAATPKTFERYTAHWRGASFGTKFEGLPVSEGLPRAMEGVFHTGSTAIIMSGWLGAANYGAIVANRVEEYLDR